MPLARRRAHPRVALRQRRVERHEGAERRGVHPGGTGASRQLAHQAGEQTPAGRLLRAHGGDLHRGGAARRQSAGHLAEQPALPQAGAPLEHHHPRAPTVVAAESGEEADQQRLAADQREVFAGVALRRGAERLDVVSSVPVELGDGGVASVAGERPVAERQFQTDQHVVALAHPPRGAQCLEEQQPPLGGGGVGLHRALGELGGAAIVVGAEGGARLAEHGGLGEAGEPEPLLGGPAGGMVELVDVEALQIRAGVERRGAGVVAVVNRRQEVGAVGGERCLEEDGAVVAPQRVAPQLLPEPQQRLAQRAAGTAVGRVAPGQRGEELARRAVGVGLEVGEDQQRLARSEEDLAVRVEKGGGAECPKLHLLRDPWGEDRSVNRSREDDAGV